MRKLLFLITTILILSSCTKENALPRIENITEGSKWTLEIGSPPEEVYNQIQLLGKEKGFDFMTNPQTQKYVTTEDTDELSLYYGRIILEDSSKYTQWVFIRFTDDKVTDILFGNDTSNIAKVSEWPDDLINEEPIKIDDHTQTVDQKLLAILKIPEYSNYQFLNPKIKPLNKPYDPGMADYKVWSFSFQTAKGEGKVSLNSVKLYFEDNQLVKIQNEYDESKPVYDPAENQWVLHCATNRYGSKRS